MSHGPRRTTEIVLFFDACMPKMEGCVPGCESDQMYLCKHRFNPKASIVYHSAYMGYLEFSDYQVAKHCFYLINKHGYYRMLARSKRFFIVTKDKKFVQDAEKVYLARRKANTPALSFDIKHGSITSGQSEITVHTVECKHGTGSHSDLMCLIEELNIRFPKTTKTQ